MGIWTFLPHFLQQLRVAGSHLLLQSLCLGDPGKERGAISSAQGAAFSIKLLFIIPTLLPVSEVGYIHPELQFWIFPYVFDVKRLFEDTQKDNPLLRG